MAIGIVVLIVTSQPAWGGRDLGGNFLDNTAGVTPRGDDPAPVPIELCECERATGGPNGLGCGKEGWFISNFENQGTWIGGGGLVPLSHAICCRPCIPKHLPAPPGVTPEDPNTVKANAGSLSDALAAISSSSSNAALTTRLSISGGGSQAIGEQGSSSSSSVSSVASIGRLTHGNSSDLQAMAVMSIGCHASSGRGFRALQCESGGASFVSGFSQSQRVSSFYAEVFYPVGQVECCTPALLLSTGEVWRVKRCNCSLSHTKDCGGMATHRLLWGFAQWRVTRDGEYLPVAPLDCCGLCLGDRIDDIGPADDVTRGGCSDLQDCFGNGICLLGACQCFEDFGGADCSASIEGGSGSERSLPWWASALIIGGTIVLLVMGGFSIWFKYARVADMRRARRQRAATNRGDHEARLALYALDDHEGSAGDDDTEDEQDTEDGRDSRCGGAERTGGGGGGSSQATARGGGRWGSVVADEAAAYGGGIEGGGAGRATGSSSGRPNLHGGGAPSVTSVASRLAALRSSGSGGVPRDLRLQPHLNHVAAAVGGAVAGAPTGNSTAGGTAAASVASDTIFEMDDMLAGLLAGQNVPPILGSSIGGGGGGHSPRSAALPPKSRPAATAAPEVDSEGERIPPRKSGFAAAAAAAAAAARLGPRRSVPSVVAPSPPGAHGLPQQQAPQQLPPTHEKPDDKQRRFEAESNGDAGAAEEGAPAPSGPPSQVYRPGTGCVVCYEKPVQVTLVPCGHANVCRHCSRRLERCPCCRREIKRRQRLYFDT